MSDNNLFVTKELPIDQLQEDATQPRQNYGVEGDQNRLFASMRDIGMQQPLVVKMIDKDLYTIIDGHRRYICAQRLGIKTVPCLVYLKLAAGEFQRVRFEVQNNRRDWKPLEKADAISQAKTAKNCETDKEVAHFLHLAPSTVSSALSLRNQNLKFVGLMEKNELPEAYRVEIGRMVPKIRKVKNLEPTDIIYTLIEKVNRKVIRNAKDFRILKRIFLRAKTNEEQLYEFLQNPNMTIAELERMTSQSNTVLLVDQLVTDLSTRAEKDEKFLPQEKGLYAQLQELLEHLSEK